MAEITLSISQEQEAALRRDYDRFCELLTNAVAAAPSPTFEQYVVAKLTGNTGEIADEMVRSIITSGAYRYLDQWFKGRFSSFVMTLLQLLRPAGYGPRGELLCLDDAKDSLVASIAWPYLAWKKLDQDLQEPSSATYDAFVNGVHVGTLSEADYSKIKRWVLRDARLYFAQVMNLGWVAIKALDTFFLGIPILGFWALFALAYFEPEAYGTIIDALQQGPDSIRAAANQYMRILFQIWLFSLLIQAAIRGHLPGFTNVFDAATARLLRLTLGVAAEGEVVLHQQVFIQAAPGHQL